MSHRIRFTWVLAGVLGVLVAAGACRRGGGARAVVTRAGGLTLEASLDPDPPRQKGNALRVTVKDAQGVPRDDAQVALRYFMPAMGAMQEMRGEAEVEQVGQGRYRARFDLPMDGSWTLGLDVRSGGSSAQVSYRMTVGSRGLTASGSATPAEAEAHAESAHGTGNGEIAYYTCSMHPSVKKHEPGTCPICSMDLVPVTRDEVETGVIRVDAQRRQLIGVRTAVVESRPLSVTIRGVGKVVYDETRLSDVSLKYRGWIGTLHADAPGQLVRKGEPLLTLYSPELYAAQEEFLTTLASQKEARGTSVPDRADYLVEAARRRLSLWDLEDAEIDRIAASGRAEKYLPVVSPVTGYLVEKAVVEGAAVQPGMRLFRIAALDRVWVEAEVYESELPLVSVGQEAEVSLPYLPGESFRGKVSFVYPYLDGQTRTGRVRIELPNRGLKLKPDMYATVTLRADRGERPVVPEEAILYAGPRRLVFLDLGEGRLRPQEIQIGVKSGDVYEVLSGLKEGDRVVVSGNFLVGAESRLKSATGQW